MTKPLLADPAAPAASNPTELPLPGKRLLTAKQAEFFARNGYLLIENALSDEEVDRYLEIVDRLDREVASDVKCNARSAGDPLEVRNAIATAPDLLPLLDHPSTFPLVADLMGPHIALTTSHVFIRPPSPEGTRAAFKAIDWHRDGPAPQPAPWQTQTPWLYTKIGYFLTDLRVPNAGALRIVPGSHRYSGPAPEMPGHFDPCGTIELQVKPGSAVLFENRVLHAVGPNFSAIPRKNIYFGYCWRFLRPIDFVSQPASLMERGSPVQRQLLGEAPNALHYYLPGAAGVPLA